MYELEKEVAWESSVLGILHKQLLVRPIPIPSTLRLDGKTAIVTGANSGLGLEAARQLLNLGLSHLVLAVRSQRNGETAGQQLRSEFPGALLQVSILDLADYDSIFAFVDRCRRDLQRIDYCVLNAGVQRSIFKRNEKTGHESVFQTNYLSTALVTLLLTSLMKEKKQQQQQDGQPSVLTVVGSDTMYFSKLRLPTTGSLFQLVDRSDRFERFQQYMDTKLLLMMFVAGLAPRVNAADVTINVCNPGLTYGTNLGREANKVAQFVMRPVVRVLGRSLHVGASVYVHALVAGGLASHGRFVSDWALKPYAAVMYTDEGRIMGEKLWQETMEDLAHIPALESTLTEFVQPNL
ncbi:hypothetical protein BDW74DRAFT_67265 [Aspergillus multicolor]|uniref:putative short-chain dehydrogenase/reductase family protein n=1 Tax=Aspergillus multicolor TaxID=41759 RepID=UPI003CCD7184